VKRFFIRYGTTLLVFLVLFPLVSCDLGGGTNYTEQWTLSGEITLNGTITHNVKIAVFYLGQDVIIDDTKPLVSNVVDLGTSTVSPIAFSLDIDVSAISYSEMDTVDVWVWEDANANDDFDAGEKESDVEPAAGCPVFYSSGFAYFSYNQSFVGIPKGWIVWNASDVFESIDTATLSSAKLQNSWPF
jgi:hypothetical protein